MTAKIAHMQMVKSITMVMGTTMMAKATTAKTAMDMTETLKDTTTGMVTKAHTMTKTVITKATVIQRNTTAKTVTGTTETVKAIMLKIRRT